MGARTLAMADQWESGPCQHLAEDSLWDIVNCYQYIAYIADDEGGFERATVGGIQKATKTAHVLVGWLCEGTPLFVVCRSTQPGTTLAERKAEAMAIFGLLGLRRFPDEAASAINVLAQPYTADYVLPIG